MRKGELRGGFTLAETALAMTVLMIALMSLSAATLRMHSLRRQNRERTVAMNTARSVADSIHSFAQETLEVNPTGWAKIVTDALQPGASIGTTFDIEELTPQVNAQVIGNIQVITNEQTTDAALGVGIGMPRDLDGDGAVNNIDVSTTARLLPVVLTVSWQGVSGAQTLRHPFYLMGY